MIYRVTIICLPSILGAILVPPHTFLLLYISSFTRGLLLYVRNVQRKTVPIYSLIHASALYEIPAPDVGSSEIKYIPEEEKAILVFGEDIPVGKSDLRLDFTGELNDKMKGFYRSKYATPDGEERFCAVTQFEVRRDGS